jgi:centriolar protein POC1
MTSVSDDGKIKVWELKHGRLGWTLYGHNGMIKSVDFSQKGDYFVTGAEDSLVMIWRSNFD